MIVLSVAFRYSPLRSLGGLAVVGIPVWILSCTFPGYQVEREAAGGDAGGSEVAGHGSGGAHAGNGATSAGADSGGAQGGAQGGASGGGGEGSVRSIRIDLVAAPYSMVQEQSGDAEAHVDQCQGHQVVIGFQGTVDALDEGNHVRSVQAICGETSVSSTGQYAVTIAQTSVLPAHNAAAEIVQTVLCPPNQLVASFSGRAGAWIDAIDVRCAPLSIVGTPPSLFLIVGNTTKVGALGSATGGNIFELVQCDAGDIAVGQVVRTAGSTAPIIAFGIRCATPRLQED